MRKLIIPVLIILAIPGCKEDDQNKNGPDIPGYDTVSIGDYFPVYPNSYWVYAGLDGDTIIHKTDSVYILWSNYNPINNPNDTSKHYLTKYDGKAVNRYRIYIGSNSYHESGWQTILPDSIYEGASFQERYEWPNTYYSGQIKKTDTTVLLNSVNYDSVIIVFEYFGPSGGELPFGKTFYAKHIGIIKTERCSVQSFDSVNFAESIIGYHIGD